MGMYTELIFGAELKKDTPKEVIDVLKYMIKDTDIIVPTPKHKFFSCARWRILFTCTSYYFGVSDSFNKLWFDKISDTWKISTRSNIKNYDGDIQEFLDWIKPYINRGSGDREFYTIVCYEEQEEPTIYYLREGSEREEGLK